MQKLNIIEFIENNPISKLSKNYNSKLLNKIKDHFIEFEQQFELGKSTVIDVRKETEYAAEHIEDAYLRPLASINDWINNLDGNHFFLHCAGGYRSMIAASILQARGIRNFTEIAGGYNAITQTNMPTTDFICQSKVL